MRTPFIYSHVLLLVCSITVAHAANESKRGADRTSPEAPGAARLWIFVNDGLITIPRNEKEVADLQKKLGKNGVAIQCTDIELKVIAATVPQIRVSCASAAIIIQKRGIRATAAKLDFDSASQLLKLQGDVKLTFESENLGRSHLQADSMQIDLGNLRMRAQGARVLKTLSPAIKLDAKRAIGFKPKPSKPKVGQSESTKPSKEAKPLADNLDRY